MFVVAMVPGLWQLLICLLLLCSCVGVPVAVIVVVLVLANNRRAKDKPAAGSKIGSNAGF